MVDIRGEEWKNYSCEDNCGCIMALCFAYNEL